MSRMPIALPRMLVAFSVAAAMAVAQERPSIEDASTTVSVRRNTVREPSVPASLRVDVNRVFIPITVTDQADMKIEGLRKEDFRLFEDGVERAISEFFIDETPVSVGVLLDSSNSMTRKWDLSKQMISSFLRLCPPEDEYLLVTVQDRPELELGFTGNPEDVVNRMKAIKPQGWTALYDGMYLAIQHMHDTLNQQRALLVVSDGGDNYSRYSESELRDLIRESGVRIFSVSILGRSQAMERFSEESGGHAFQARKLDELPELAYKASALMHGEYVLGFSPANHPRDGKYHNIKIQVAQPADGSRVHATWRHGYYAPVQ